MECGWCDGVIGGLPEKSGQSCRCDGDLCFVVIVVSEIVFVVVVVLW